MHVEICVSEIDWDILLYFFLLIHICLVSIPFLILNIKYFTVT